MSEERHRHHHKRDVGKHQTSSSPTSTPRVGVVMPRRDVETIVSTQHAGEDVPANVVVICQLRAVGAIQTVPEGDGGESPANSLTNTSNTSTSMRQRVSAPRKRARVHLTDAVDFPSQQRAPSAATSVASTGTSDDGDLKYSAANSDDDDDDDDGDLSRRTREKRTSSNAAHLPLVVHVTKGMTRD